MHCIRLQSAIFLLGGACNAAGHTRNSPLVQSEAPGINLELLGRRIGAYASTRCMSPPFPNMLYAGFMGYQVTDKASKGAQRKSGQLALDPAGYAWSWLQTQFGQLRPPQAEDTMMYITSWNKMQQKMSPPKTALLDTISLKYFKCKKSPTLQEPASSFSEHLVPNK